MGSKGRDQREDHKESNLQKNYFDVLGLCCSSEVPLIEKILKPLEGVVEVSVIVPSRTLIVVHDTNLISQQQIVKALNRVGLEANVRVKGIANYKAKWPSPYVIICGVLLSLSFLKYVYHPLQWLAVAAVVVGIWPVIRRGFVAVQNSTLDVNILVLIAVVGTIAMKDYEEAGIVVFLFTIAEWLESRASEKATAVMSSLLSMTPQKATIAETGEVVNVEDVKVNTIVAVKAGEMIPVDGIVVEGTCEVDEKALTGESYPVAKQKDSTVWAGTVNVNGYINLKTTGLAGDCAVAKMAKLVEEAQNKRSSVQRLIDKCAKFYTPAVIFISAGLAALPAILKVHDLRHWLYLSLVVLVSACPCALILSTPVATFCALSRAATTGVLIKGGDYLEILGKIKTVAFDKTGTITTGEFTLMNFLSLADDVSLSTLLYWVSSIESKSSHPIASVLVDYGQSQSIEPKPEYVDDFQNFPGEGVSGKIDGKVIYVGNTKLAHRANCNVVSNIGGDSLERGTIGYVYCDGALVGTFSVSDNCRSGAADAIKELKKMGVRTALLTGDNQSAATLAQDQIGNGLDSVHAELLPEDKARIIADYRKQGPTAMVGDGVNDAPALATADVGISMGVSGSALATETGHVILMSNDIRKIPKAIKLARKTRRKVIENIVISITTKAGVLAAAFAWHPLVWLAVLVDVGTCLVVILNSMLLLRGHTDHAHVRKWFGLFPCNHHQSKCRSSGHHSEVNQRCCSQKAAPELCKPLRSSSRSHTGHSHTNCESHATEVPYLSKSVQCCSRNPDTLGLKSFYCFPHEQCRSRPLNSGACVQNSHNLAVIHSKGGHNYHKSTCCDEDHCLQALESQVSCDGSDKVDDGKCCANWSCETAEQDTVPECHHAHPKQEIELDCHYDHPSILTNHHHHEPQTCCKGLDGTKASNELAGQNLTVHCVSVGQVHNENNVSACKDHCTRSHENHAAHHHSVVHGVHHADAVARHACTSLRKREAGACCKSFRNECCSSEGHFVAGFEGLTGIVTE